VAALVSEVATASEQQASGVEQINTAVGQMDHITQSNAANAEESASASEELSAQAVELKDMVEQLLVVVNGAGGAPAQAPARAPFRTAAASPARPPSGAPSRRAASFRAHPPAPRAPGLATPPAAMAPPAAASELEAF
jgi:methyl-accepting chemotaxis protein